MEHNNQLFNKIYIMYSDSTEYTALYINLDDEEIRDQLREQINYLELTNSSSTKIRHYLKEVIFNNRDILWRSKDKKFYTISIDYDI